jgi:hypothetical protein
VVRDYLTQHFKLDDTRIKTFGGGKTPDAPAGGEVQVAVYAGGAAPGSSKDAEQPGAKKK